MKKTEQRWMHIESGEFAARGIVPSEYCIAEYELVTVTYDEPEWEEVEVVRMYCPECQTVMTKKEHEQNNCCKNAVELRGTYRRRKPEPEVETYFVCETYNAKGYKIGQIQVPETLIGKRVRVEDY